MFFGFFFYGLFFPFFRDSPSDRDLGLNSPSPLSFSIETLATLFWPRTPFSADLGAFLDGILPPSPFRRMRRVPFFQLAFPTMERPFSSHAMPFFSGVCLSLCFRNLHGILAPGFFSSRQCPFPLFSRRRPGFEVDGSLVEVSLSFLPPPFFIPRTHRLDEGFFGASLNSPFFFRISSSTLLLMQLMIASLRGSFFFSLSRSLHAHDLRFGDNRPFFETH